ncbi:hypothetical protein SDC9_179789 [bioreactor metagenome]|uniref:Uncharacterized protein n=1 Tax=bioreactor metagenome TaxID=1076179 RepID=A0A645GZT3_9ZZZZ
MDDTVVKRCVQNGWDKARSDTLDFVRAFRFSAQYSRIGRLQCIYFHIGIDFAQSLADARHCSARSDSGNKSVRRLAFKSLDDFGTGDGFVHSRIGRVIELHRHEVIRLRSDFPCLRNRAIHPLSAGCQYQLCAISRQQ